MIIPPFFANALDYPDRSARWGQSVRDLTNAAAGSEKWRCDVGCAPRIRVFVSSALLDVWSRAARLQSSGPSETSLLEIRSAPNLHRSAGSLASSYIKSFHLLFLFFPSAFSAALQVRSGLMMMTRSQFRSGTRTRDFGRLG